jgi:hypothetical protein
LTVLDRRAAHFQMVTLFTAFRGISREHASRPDINRIANRERAANDPLPDLRVAGGRLGDGVSPVMGRQLRFILRKNYLLNGRGLCRLI